MCRGLVKDFPGADGGWVEMGLAPDRIRSSWVQGPGGPGSDSALAGMPGEARPVRAADRR